MASFRKCCVYPPEIHQDKTSLATIYNEPDLAQPACKKNDKNGSHFWDQIQINKKNSYVKTLSSGKYDVATEWKASSLSYRQAQDKSKSKEIYRS